MESRADRVSNASTDAVDGLAYALRDLINEAVPAAVERDRPTRHRHQWLHVPVGATVSRGVGYQVVGMRIFRGVQP
jgi:hypothetical protein